MGQVYKVLKGNKVYAQTKANKVTMVQKKASNAKEKL